MGQEPEARKRKVDRIEPTYLGLGPLFHIARDAVIVGDASNGQILLWNDAAARIFGYTSDEAMGMLLEDLVPSGLKQAHRKGLARYAQTGKGPLVNTGQVVELPAVRKDGTEIVVELTLTPVETDRLPGRFAMAVIRDVTERTRHLAEIEKANIGLRGLNEAMADFISVASHDLRSPVTAIVGFASTLNRTWETSTDEKKREFAAVIERQARFLSRLINDLLTLTRIEAKALDVEPEILLVLPAIREAMEFYAQQTEIQTHVHENLSVFADADHLRRMIANFVGNAVRYGAPPIVIRAEERQGSVEILVCDQGEGVPADLQSRLFQKFARANEKGSDGEKGSGLGLSIVKGLAEANRGEVWYEPNAPKGACFGIKLPLAPPSIP